MIFIKIPVGAHFVYTYRHLSLTNNTDIVGGYSLVSWHSVAECQSVNTKSKKHASWKETYPKM